jgi:hypothetical protein
MKKSVLKNIIICALAVTCALLTIRLWFGNFLIHGLFPGEPVVAANPAHQRMAQGMVESAKMTINLDGQSHEVIYSNFSAHYGWEVSARAISALINEGVFDRSGAQNGDGGPEISVGDNIVIAYNFAMPTGFFREQFGQRPGFLSSVFTDFETLVITPRRGDVHFHFLSDENAMFHTFTLTDALIYNDFRDYFTQRAQEPEIARNENFEIRPRNPIGEQMLHANVREFVLFFFPNPAAASDGVTINGVYTYKDNARVVKFYPNNVVEYNALLNTRPSGTVSLASSLLAALDMLDRDGASMLANGTGEPMNDVFLAGYSVGPEPGQWNFYFDYVVGGRPIQIDEDIGILNHAVEIHVINNAVAQYRRLMLNFYEGEYQ